MNAAYLKYLLRITMTNPRQAGREVIALGLPLQGLWMALMLMAILLSLMVSGVFHGAPLPPGAMGDAIRMSPAYHSPLIFAVINWGQAVMSVFVLHWIGRMFGGQGTLGDMLAVMIWLQFVSLVLAAVLFVAGLIVPVAGGVLTLMALAWGLWATVALVDAANRFDNIFKALGVCLAAVVAFSVGITLFSAVLGGLSMGGG
ncbi:Yip1 family protein [Roseovarius amoyensis]|uniref:Yip1 family protein n=1 Tax=Roseovarius amoyensis TaxID=2211448 RepID=UPI0013A6D646|nr:Yip1 family protein [Roseovarius amoyensis]